MSARLVAGLLSAVLALGAAPDARAQANQQADAAPLRFTDPAEEARFHALAAELRCVMCQNQSLADSNAQIAHDLRREVLALMRRDMTDAQVKAHLVARYGEFVLYRPRIQPSTWLLWFGPLLLLGAGGVAIARIVGQRRRGAALVPDDTQDW